MSEKKNKMIDPTDVRALLEAYDGSDQSHSDRRDLISGLRNLLPRDYPEDMLGMWAEHPEYGRVLVCDSKPDGDGEVAIKFRDDGECTGVSQKWVDPSTLSFPEQHPEHLTTAEEYAALPAGSIVAEPGKIPLSKIEEAWSQDLFEYRSNRALAGTARQVLRRGWGK